MDQNILVSICVPIYRVEKFIKKCAETLFNQTLRARIEYIFVDDCSPDNSVTILKAEISKHPDLSEQIKIISHPKNLGLAKARETAVNAAQGYYLFHCDSDDYLEYDSIEKLLKPTLDGVDYDIITGSAKSIYGNRTTIISCPNISSPKVLAIKMMERKASYNIWNRLIKKELYHNLDIPNINNGEDYVATCRLFYKARKIHNIQNVTYNYTHFNEHSFQNQCHLKDNIKDLNESSVYLKKYYNDVKSLEKPLNIGHLMAYLNTILSCNDIDIIKRMRIPNDLMSYATYTNLGRTYIFYTLYKLHFWNLFKWLNHIRLKYITK